MITGCRISHQLRDYNPRLFGISAFNGTRYRAVTQRAHTTTPFGFAELRYSKSLLRLKLGINASFYSSSSVADNTGDFAGVSYAHSDCCGQDVSELPVVVNRSLSPAENGRIPPTEEVASVAGGIVALGKFDALHIGHRELAIQASKIGVPYLLSFVGMGEVLGWEPRPPIVAKCDRKRVLSSWAPLCNNRIPKEYHVEFSKVRHLTPQQFVQKLSQELGVHGVVAGENYRFGYKTSGNASDLVQLCEDYGMEACIIRSVMDSHRQSSDQGSANSQEQGQVSSTRVRYALSIGDMKYVSQLLGRCHRLVLMVNKRGKFYSDDRKWLSAPKSCSLNCLPTEGLYNNCLLILGDENAVRCRVIIDTTDIHLEFDKLAPQNLEFLSIEFGDSKA